MIYEKIDKLFTCYLNKDLSIEEIYHFQYQYEVLFSFFKQELLDELGEKNYGILDTIYMLFDSYEPDENIRKYDDYCIDEITLCNKVKLEYKKIRFE